MKQKAQAYITIAVIAVVAIIIICSSSFYVVDIKSQCVITEFGKPKKVVTEPGLKVKTPFIQKTKYFEKRIIEWDGESSDILTRDKENIVTDPRIAESDLGYLTRERFEKLSAKAKEDPFIFTRDWFAQASQEEKDELYNGHVEVWNQAIKRNSGKPFAFVLHVEGMQLFVNELLDRPRDKMIDLHFKRGSYVHAQVFPDRDAIVSF